MNQNKKLRNFLIYIVNHCVINFKRLTSKDNTVEKLIVANQYLR